MSPPAILHGRGVQARGHGRCLSFAVKSRITIHESPITAKAVCGIVRSTPEKFGSAPTALDARTRDPAEFHAMKAWRPPCTRWRPEGGMFDLITGKTTHIPNRPALPIVATSLAEALALLVIVVLPVLFVTDNIP